jgi:hypothetical protein
VTISRKAEAPRLGVTIPEVIKTSGHYEEGALLMIVTIPPRLQSFCGRFGEALSEARRAALAWLLAGFLLTRERRTQSALGRGVLSEERKPSSVSRRMRRGSFRTRDMVRAEMKRQIARELARAGGKPETWFLAIDGVASKRGGRTKVENAVQYKEKQRGKKGRSTKAEVFFRELKSDLGLSDYRGTEFRAFERHVDLVLLSFMLLEEMRVQEMARTRSPVKRRELAGLRTSGMKARLAREAHAADVSWIMQLVEARKGRGHLKRLLPSLALAA